MVYDCGDGGHRLLHMVEKMPPLPPWAVKVASKLKFSELLRSPRELRLRGTGGWTALSSGSREYVLSKSCIISTDASPGLRLLVDEG